MQGHSQTLMLSSKIHSTFGLTLMFVGVSRILELLLVPVFHLRSELSANSSQGGDKHIQSDVLDDISALEHIRPLVSDKSFE